MIRTLIVYFALAASLCAEISVEEALRATEKDVSAAQAQLAAVRKEIAAERPALVEEFAEVELSLREKRRLVRIARMSREDREEELRQLERKRAQREQDATYLAGLLKDHALKIDTVTRPGEPRLDLDAAVLAREMDEPAEALGERLSVVGASLDRLEALLGGSKAPGKAVAGDGRVIEGVFAAAGPAVWFKGAEGTTGEIVQGSLSSTPRIWEERNGPLNGLFSGEEVSVRVDVTGGKARTLEDIRGGIWSYVSKGGLWIWPILLLALVATAIGVIKLLALIGYREVGDEWIKGILAAWKGGDREGAVSLATSVKHPAGPVMERLLTMSSQEPEVVEESLYEQLMGVRQRMSSLLPVLAVTAATAPLLGLLGTVSGMIRTFNLIALFGSGDPKPLAGGISEALITTLFGLAVAIPALILHAFLSRRSQGLIETTERHGLAFVNGLREE